MQDNKALAEQIALTIIINDPSENEINELIKKEADKAGIQFNYLRQMAYDAYHGPTAKVDPRAAAEYNKR